MKTDDLIAQLGAKPQVGRWGGPSFTIALAVLISCAIIAGVSSVWLGLPTSLGNTRSIVSHSFLLNFAFIVSVGSVAMVLVRDLSVPGRSLKLPFYTVAIPFVLLSGSALQELGDHVSHHPDWSSLLVCVWKTSMLALPALLVLAIGLRRLAPTDLRRTGFCIGLLAGAIGSMGYCLHSPNESLTFGVLVYAANAIFMAVIGALAGPRLLRWQ